MSKFLVAFGLLVLGLPASSAQPAPEIPQRGLELWLKADAALKVENGSIVRWPDASLRANDAVRGSAPGVPASNPALVPAAANGKPALRFDGTDAWFSFRRITDMRTVFWVASKDPAAFGQRLERFVLGDTGFGLRYNADFHPGTHTKSFLLHGNTSAAFLREGQVRLNGRLVDGTATDFPKTLGVVSFVSTGHVGASRLGFDRGYPGRGWQGEIAEVIAYNRVLADGERAAVERYLFAKYGIEGADDPAPASPAWTAAAAAGATPAPRTADPRPFVVADLAWSPDGKSLATASDAVRVWDPATGQLLRALPGRPPPESHPPVPAQPGQFTSVVFGGRLILAAATDLKLWAWEPSGHAVELTPDLAHASALWGLASPPDGRTLWVDERGKENAVRGYDRAAGRALPALQAPPKGWGGRLWCVAPSPDGSKIAASNETRSIRLWNSSGAFLAEFDAGSIPWSLAWSPDGRTLAAGCVNMTVQLWDVASGRLKQTLAGHAAAVTAVAYSPSGRVIASGSDDSTIRFWDGWTGQFLKKVDAHPGGVWCLAFSPDGRTLASGGEDLVLRLWDGRDGRPIREIDVDPGAN